MNNQPITRDERTVAVENSSYRLAYLLLSYGLLADVAYRGFVGRESSWDLLALVVLGGVVTTLYQWANKVLSRSWAVAAITTVVIAALLAGAIAWLRNLAFGDFGYFPDPSTEAFFRDRAAQERVSSGDLRQTV